MAMADFIPHKAYPLEQSHIKQAQDRRVKDDIEGWKKAGGVIQQLGWGDKSDVIDKRRKTRGQRVAIDVRTVAKQRIEPNMFIALDTLAAEEEE